jgi:uncharacterized delta-60 repeat protein
MHTSSASLPLTLLAMALTPAVASAAPGDLDPTFGTGGKRILPGVEAPIDVFVQPDGKIVEVAGQSLAFGFSGFLVRRTLPDGSPDRTFDGDGTAVTRFPNVAAPGSVHATASALQPDGSLVVAGYAGTGAIAVARFTSDGALDETFDPGGDDGDGRRVFSPVAGLYVRDVVLQSGGRIALVGTEGNDGDFGVLRLRTDGSSDGTAFDPGDFAGNNDEARSAVQEPAGTTLVAGASSSPDATVTGLVRYRPDGKLDASLAGTGRTTVASIEEPRAVAVQPDGRVLVLGTAGGEVPNMVLTRLTRTGSVDTTFGNGGTATSRLADRRIDPAAIVLQPDGKIVVSGTLTASPETAEFDFVVARFDRDGHLDPGYGSGGLATVSFGGLEMSGPAAIQPDGKVVIAGYALDGIMPRVVLARLLADPAPAPAPGPGAHGAPGNQPQPQPRPLPDTLAPQLRALRVTARYVRFTLPEAARVRFTLQPARPSARRATFTARGVPGANRVRLARRLKPGRYRLTATATDAAGNGRTQRISFTVKKGRA